MSDETIRRRNDIDPRKLTWAFAFVGGLSLLAIILSATALFTS